MTEKTTPKGEWQFADYDIRNFMRRFCLNFIISRNSILNISRAYNIKELAKLDIYKTFLSGCLYVKYIYFKAYRIMQRRE